MALEGVERRYAQALFAVGKDKGLAEKFNGDLTKAEKLLAANPELYAALLSPQIDRGVKKNILKEIFAGKISPQVLNFLFLLVDKDRFARLSRMGELYLKIYLESRGEIEGWVETVTPLTPDLEAGLVNALSRLENKKIKLQTRINPELLGGMVITIEDRIWDLSLAGRLKALKAKLS